MNKMANKFLFAGDIYMSELHLRQGGLTYSAWRSFIKHLERFQKFRETGNLKNNL